MRVVLVVSPHFPPVNAPDMHRVRVSLPYFGEFGWKAIVLAVRQEDAGRPVDPLLLETLPADLPVTRVQALPVGLTRTVGISALGLRALPYLYRAGGTILRREPVDLVYFSTTAFPAMTLGRVWKAQCGVPYVLDLQDPWVGDYYEQQPRRERTAKYWLARRMHTMLEAWTMREVGGIIAVSKAYHERLRQKYPWIREELCDTITFGASSLDFEVATRAVPGNPYFRRLDGYVHGVSVGVLGKPKRRTCEAVCAAFRRGLNERSDLFRGVRLHLIGTAQESGRKAVATIAPIAAAAGVAEFIQEAPEPIPYSSAIKLLEDADFLLLLGSDDPHYTASKLYPYILSRKPLLAVFHESSSVVEVLRTTDAGEVVTFRDRDDSAGIAASLLKVWTRLLERLPYQPATDWQAFQPYTAREIARRQCALFDLVAGRAAEQQSPGIAKGAGAPA